MHSSSSYSRRDFLLTAACSAAAASLINPFTTGLADEKSARWTTAIRDVHLKTTGEPTCWAALKRLEVAGAEVQVNEALDCPGLYSPAKTYRVATAADRQALQEELAAQGVTITAFCMNNRLDERLPQEVDWMRRLADAAEQLKVRAVRIDVVAHALPADQFLPFAIKACRQLCEVIKDKPVKLGIENHGRYTNNPEFLEKLFDGVGSDQLGLTLDTMNFYWYGHPLQEIYKICEKFASRAFHTHCKNLLYPEDKKNVRRDIGWEYEQHAAPVYGGDIDYGRVAGILRKANYTGDLCLENECLGRFPKDQHVAVLKREIETLRRLA